MGLRFVIGASLRHSQYSGNGKVASDDALVLVGLDAAVVFATFDEEESKDMEEGCLLRHMAAGELFLQAADGPIGM